MTPKEIIKHLELSPHPEGGYFKETYRSSDSIMTAQGTRSVSSAIYFLLETNNFSAFHKIKSDELWHHYEGVALEVIMIKLSGDLEILKLGKNLKKGERAMQLVPKDTWFASRVVQEGFALVGCTVAPGFDFSDFKLADRFDLIKLFPKHAKIITELTRQKI